MRWIVNVLVSFLSVILLVSCASKSSVTGVTDAYRGPVILLDSSVYNKVEFVDNSKSNPAYLSVNVSFSPLINVREQLEKSEKRLLLNRGEGHITVLNPMEYEQLNTVLPKELINEIAHLNRIQQVPFEVLCLGRGQKQEGAKTLSTYFIVIEAPELVRLRRSLHTLYITRGGQPNLFVPEFYQPHITIGFTERDLHILDGIEKNKASCYSEIQIKGQ